MLTLNGLTVIDAVLSLPRTGVWHADLRVDTSTDVAGPVTIDVDEGKLTLRGSVIRGGNWQDTGVLRVAGGAGGLRLNAKPKHYTATSLRIVLTDLLAGAGEKLSPSANANLLKRQVNAWTTAALPAGRLITQLLGSAAPDATWRVLPDGTVWVGQEQWPDSGLADGNFQVLTEDPSRAEALLGVESALLLPGTTLGGRRVSYVEHRVGDPETRTSVWFDSGAPDDRLKAAIRGFVKAAQSPIDYLACYFATVVSQNVSTVDVRPTDPRIPSMAGVPLFAGLPHWALKLKPGGRVLIGWSGGDPSQPYAQAFDSDVSAALISIGDADKVEPAILGATYRSAEDAYLTLMATAIVNLGAAVTALGNTSASSSVADLATGATTFSDGAASYLSTQVRHS